MVRIGRMITWMVRKMIIFKIGRVSSLKLKRMIMKLEEIRRWRRVRESHHLM